MPPWDHAGCYSLLAKVSTILWYQSLESGVQIKVIRVFVTTKLDADNLIISASSPFGQLAELIKCCCCIFFGEPEIVATTNFKACPWDKLAHRPICTADLHP